MKKITLLFLLGFLAFSQLFAQSYPRGAVLDDALYNSLPRKAPQLTRSLLTLPKSASLKQYAPHVGNQGHYGTCTAWATAYAARTISESIVLNRLDKSLTTGNVFSPVFIYKSISDDSSCRSGTAISHALNVMKDPGVPRRSSAEQSSDFKLVQLSTYLQSARFPIADYVILYNYWRGQTGNEAARVQAVKKSLSEGKPVIIGMNTPASFNNAKSPWAPLENSGISYGGHAMCVVGYDDNMHGGAFEILNSWGEDWGEQGYIWIPYNTFAQFANQAYELIENLHNYNDATLYSGFVYIEVDGSDKGMPVRFDESGYYKTANAWPSGTRFRFIMGNNHPAYVYAFTADSSTSEINLIFPLAEFNESPILDYSQNMVAWPGENDWIQMDDVKGTDYLVVLYSKQEQDIDSIMARFATAAGTFPQRVASAVGSDYISHSNIKYVKSNIRFNCSMLNKQAVMGLLLAIDHK